VRVGQYDAVCDGRPEASVALCANAQTRSAARA
jgi:hypothetical protein